MRPDVFLPDEGRGAGLYAAIRRRLAASYAHIFAACEPLVALDQSAIAVRADGIRDATRIRPELFVLHNEALTAACRADAASIRSAAASFIATPHAAPERLVVRNWGDPSFGTTEAERYAWAFGEDGDTPVTLHAADPDAFLRASDCLEAAREVLAAAAPALRGEIDAIVGEVVFAAGSISDQLTFDGISTFQAFGALVLNAQEHRSIPGALAGYVHEAAHLLLFAHTEGNTLVDNGPEAIHASPLRPDPRPMDGIFHATFVSARMAFALDHALGSDTLAASDRDDAARLLAGARRAFADGLAVLRAAGRPTAVGRPLIDAAEATMRPVD